MDAAELDISQEALQGKKRQIRKKNAAFRRGLEKKKELSRTKATRLRLAAAAAALSWAVVGIQLLR